jgi:hypothetical protein
MHDQTILAETTAYIEHILGDDLDRIRIERAAVGLFFTGVKLSTGAAGACATRCVRFRGRSVARVPPLLPDPLPRRGVDVLGGIRVTAPDAFLDVLAEGESG